MQTFKEYAEQRKVENVALLLWATETDINEFCETVLVLAQNGKLNEEVLTELGWRNMLGGISNAAANLAGLGGLGRMAGDAGRAAGSAIANKAAAAGNAVASGAASARDAIAQRYAAGKAALGRGASAVGSAVQAGRDSLNRNANAAGNAIASGAAKAWDATGGAVGRGASQLAATAGGYMQQSKQAEQLRQATNAVNALQQQLQGYGYSPDLLNSALSPLLQALQHDTEQNSANRGYKMGSGNYGGGAAPAAGSAVA